MDFSSLHNCLPSPLILLNSLVEKGTGNQIPFEIHAICQNASDLVGRLHFGMTFQHQTFTGFPVKGLKILSRWMVVLDVHVVEPQLLITRPRTMYLGN